MPTIRWPEVLKTKAHRTRKEAVRQGDLADWTGNNMADQAAKEAALQGEPADISDRVQCFREKA